MGPHAETKNVLVQRAFKARQKKRNSRICRPGKPSNSNSSWAHGEKRLAGDYADHNTKGMVSLTARRHVNQKNFYEKIVLPTIHDSLCSTPLCLLSGQDKIDIKMIRRLLARRSVDVAIHELSELFSPINSNFDGSLVAEDLRKFISKLLKR